MPVRIYDISKKLGLENKEVLAKAKELGITLARVASSSLDKITAEYLEDQLKATHPRFLAPPTPPAPPPVLEPAAPPAPPPAPVPVPGNHFCHYRSAAAGRSPGAARDPPASRRPLCSSRRPAGCSGAAAAGAPCAVAPAAPIPEAKPPEPAVVIGELPPAPPAPAPEPVTAKVQEPPAPGASAACAASARASARAENRRQGRVHSTAASSRRQTRRQGGQRQVALPPGRAEKGRFCQTRRPAQLCAAPGTAGAPSARCACPAEGAGGKRGRTGAQGGSARRCPGHFDQAAHRGARVGGAAQAETLQDYRRPHRIGHLQKRQPGHRRGRRPEDLRQVPLPVRG